MRQAVSNLINNSKNKKVYIALDNSHLSSEITNQISCFGYDGNAFNKPNTLINAIKKNSPEIVIIDTDFGSQDNFGIGIIEKLHSENISFTTIFVSTDDTLEKRLLCARAKGQAFITKPIEFSNLLEKLEYLTQQNDSEPFRVLVVEDSRAQAYFISNTLMDAGMKTEVVDDPFGLMKSLVNFRPELILMDVYLPKCTGLELANVIRQQDAYVSVPIVFLSSEQDLSKQLTGMMLGGDDFLTKPITPEHLITAINSRAKRSRILRSHMIRDSLTGLLNHTNLLEQLDIEVSRSVRADEQLCFAMLDIDNFKKVNDKYGHPVGDRVIKSLSHLLQQRLRRSDTVGRYGGEEFAIVLPDTNIKQAKAILEEIKESFCAIKQFAGHKIFNTTFSAGIALAKGQDIGKLTEHADQALYQAKENGRNQIVCYDAG